MTTWYNGDKAGRRTSLTYEKSIMNSEKSTNVASPEQLKAWVKNCYGDVFLAECQKRQAETGCDFDMKLIDTVHTYFVKIRQKRSREEAGKSFRSD